MTAAVVPVLPLTRSVRFVHALTWALAALLFVSSLTNLGYGRAWLYDDDPMLPALIGQDRAASGTDTSATVPPPSYRKDGRSPGEDDD